MSLLHHPILRPLRFLFHFLPFLLSLLVADLLLTLTLPLSPIIPLPIYNLNSYICHLVWTHIHHILLLHTPRISYSGSFPHNIPPKENALIIANHLSWSDFYFIQALAREKGMLGRCRYFAKAALKWVPLLGWGFVALGMPLVKRDWTRDEEGLKKLFGRVKRNMWPMWLVSYSEGTRLTPQKLAESQSWAKSKGKPILKHVLYPRTKGFIACIQHLRTPDSHIRHIYDMTIAYQYTPHSPSPSSSASSPSSSTISCPPKPILQLHPLSIYDTFARATLSPPWRIHVHVERFAIEDLPEDDAGVGEWLEERWKRKDELLEGLEGEWVEWKGLGEVGYLS